MRVEWKGSITVSHVSHSNKTSDRNDEKMYSVTNKRYFRRHECPYEDLWRWPLCHVQCDCHVVASRAWSELSNSADCQSECSRVWSELHSRHTEDEDEDEVVHVQVCFHLPEFLSSSLFFKVFCFLASSISSSLAFIFSDNFHGHFWRTLTNSHQNREVSRQICWSYAKISVLELQDPSRLTDIVVFRHNHGIIDVLWSHFSRYPGFAHANCSTVFS